jgi:hypothetical protein
MSLDASRKNGISSWCRSCRTLSTRKWTAKNIQEVNHRKRVAHHRDYSYRKARDLTLKRRYGITQQWYDLKLEEQEHSCAICGRSAKEMTYLLHVDHDHRTGDVRGLLCSPCNVYLGYIKDRQEVLQTAINYLDKERKK